MYFVTSYSDYIDNVIDRWFSSNVENKKEEKVEENSSSTSKATEGKTHSKGMSIFKTIVKITVPLIGFSLIGAGFLVKSSYGQKEIPKPRPILMK